MVSLVVFAHGAVAAEPQASPTSNTALEQRIAELERELQQILGLRWSVAAGWSF